MDATENTLQRIVEDAATNHWLMQTLRPVPNPMAIGTRLSGQTIHAILRAEESHAQD